MTDVKVQTGQKDDDLDEQREQQQGRGPGSDGNKPIAEMTDAEKAAYFQRKADRLQGRLQQFGDLTPEALTDLRNKALAHENTQRELMSDHERALADAKAAAEQAAQSTYLPQLVDAEFRVAAKGRLESEALAAALAPIDRAHFIKDGKVDAEAVANYVESIAPAPAQGKRGPSSMGLGRRNVGDSAPGAAGRAAAERRFGKKNV